jgi:hypothetical protein
MNSVKKTISMFDGIPIPYKIIRELEDPVALLVENEIRDTLVFHISNKNLMPPTFEYKIGYDFS